MTQPYQLAPVPLFRVQDNNNRPLAGGQVFTYIAGTTTPQASYPSPSSGSPNANPVILNARGEAAIWLDPALTYKVNVLDSGGNQIPGYPVDNIPGGTNLTQQGLGQILNPRTPAENTAGIAPSNFVYTEGNLLRYGADPTGAASSWQALANAAAVCKISGQVLVVPPGDYLIDTINGTITLEFMTIRGAGTVDLYGTQAEGSVFRITGTTNTPFAIRRGVSFDGINFLYPNNVTDGVPPTVYPPTIIDDSSVGPVNHIYIQRCKVYNAYRFLVLTSSVGLIWIEDNNIYGILTCIEMQYNIDSMWIRGNSFSFDLFNAAQLETNPSFRYTTRTTGTAILVHQTDGITITDNILFGYLTGISFATTTSGGNGGLAQQNIINGNVFDQTVTAISASGPGRFTLNTIAGNMFAAQDAVVAQHTLIGNAISVTTSGSGAESNQITGNSFTISTGDAILISGNVTSRQYSISANTFNSWGTYQTSGTYSAVNATGNNAAFFLTDNTVLAAGSAGATLNGFTISAAGALATGNFFSFCNLPLNMSAPGVVSGNSSVSTGGASSQSYGFPSTVVDLANKWDKDTYASTGWGTPTGAVLVTNFPGATATLVQCSETIAQLLTILKNHGLIGA